MAKPASIVIGIALLIAAGTAFWLRSLPEPELEFESGHERMLAILALIGELTEDEHPFLGSAGVRKREAEYSEARVRGCSPLEEWGFCYDIGIGQVRLGDVENGLLHLERAYDLLPEVDFRAGVRKGLVAAVAPGNDPQTHYECVTRFELGIACLRLGETQNCCLKHSAESCILPIRGAGIHTNQTGSRRAIGYFREVLDKLPATLGRREDLEYRQAAKWLLNVAYMTLDEFPAKVPPEYALPKGVLESDVDIPRFENVAPALGLDTFNLCGGAIVDDFDGDGYLDIVTSTWDTRGGMRIFRNDRNGQFSNRTEEAGLTGFLGGLNMVHADFDNDGDLDVFVLRGAWLGAWGQHPNSLLQNDGSGRFRDVTFEAGLGEVHYPTKTAAWADYDNDGHLDLFVGNEATTDIASPCQLFHNNGNGTFTDLAAAAGVADPLFAMGVVWGDYDGDRDPDLYISTGFSSLTNMLELRPPPNRLYRNNGDGTFTDVAAELEVGSPASGFPCWFWDYDNDGSLDLYASCSSGPVGVLASSIRLESNSLYRGDGKGGFRDVAEEANLTYPAQPMGANFGDLDNDGFLDFYLATGNIQYSELRPNVMFLNRGGARFANVTMAGGFGHLQKGHGVAFADLDNDGDQDVYTQMGGAWPGDKFNDALFRNPGFGHHWIGVRLIGRRSNRCGIGARIHLRVTEDGVQRSIYRHVNSGGSFGGNPLRQNIGLGDATIIDRLEVEWPTTGETQLLTDVPVDQFIEITEDEPGFTTKKLRTLNLAGSQSP